MGAATISLMGSKISSCNEARASHFFASSSQVSASSSMLSRSSRSNPIILKPPCERKNNGPNVIPAELTVIVSDELLAFVRK